MTWLAGVTSATTRVPALAGLSFVSLTPIVPGRFGNRGFAAIELDLSDQGAAPTVLNRSDLVSKTDASDAVASFYARMWSPAAF
jgi:hypothetical protein